MLSQTCHGHALQKKFFLNGRSTKTFFYFICNHCLRRGTTLRQGGRVKDLRQSILSQQQAYSMVLSSSIFHLYLWPRLAKYVHSWRFNHLSKRYKSTMFTQSIHIRRRSDDNGVIVIMIRMISRWNAHAHAMTNQQLISFLKSRQKFNGFLTAKTASYIRRMRWNCLGSFIVAMWTMSHKNCATYEILVNVNRFAQLVHCYSCISFVKGCK